MKSVEWKTYNGDQKVRSRMIKDSDKYSNYRMKPGDIDLIMKYFGDAIKKVEAFEKLLAGKYFVNNIDTDYIELQERGAYASTDTMKFRYKTR